MMIGIEEQSGVMWNGRQYDLPVDRLVPDDHVKYLRQRCRAMSRWRSKYAVTGTCVGAIIDRSRKNYTYLIECEVTGRIYKTRAPEPFRGERHEGL